MRYLAVLLLACGPKVETVADGCYELGVASCDRLQSCGLDSGGTSCYNGFTQTCCNNISCSNHLPHPERVFSCADLLKAETCGDWAASLLPNGCKGWAQ